MAIVVKSERELSLMRQAGGIVAEVLQLMRDTVRSGVTTAELDAVADELIRKRGASPSFKGYHGFPASICASLNDEVVHGIPSKKRVLREGDLLSVDVGAKYRGYHGDAAITLAVGSVSPEVQRLMDVTQAALAAGIAAARSGNRLWDVIRAIESTVRAAGYDVLHGYQGHGIGRQMHEDPGVPNSLADSRGRPPNIVLRRGMTMALEPMVVMGSGEPRVLDDKWTVVTADGSLSAHFEHSLAITNGVAEILTAGGV
ncbi:MAG: type I methionyl aminopeptidase [Thermoflexales bacterium]|nr:type I methionyl aminopeptidase [Thermoflexales bacterium]